MMVKIWGGVKRGIYLRYIREELERRKGYKYILIIKIKINKKNSLNKV